MFCVSPKDLATWNPVDLMLLEHVPVRHELCSSLLVTNQRKKKVSALLCLGPWIMMQSLDPILCLGKTTKNP
jgi:hypothetical protein